MTHDNGKPLQLLVVDDNPGDLELIREALDEGTLPMRVTAAGNGAEAMALIDAGTRRFDFVLADLNMPRLDGRQFLTRLRDRAEYADVPVVVFTTSQSYDDVVLSYMNGANCYVTKPIDLDEFIGRIRAIERFWLEPVFRARCAADREVRP